MPPSHALVVKKKKKAIDSFVFVMSLKKKAHITVVDISAVTSFSTNTRNPRDTRARRRRIRPAKTVRISFRPNTNNTFCKHTYVWLGLATSDLLSGRFFFFKSIWNLIGFRTNAVSYEKTCQRARRRPVANGRVFSPEQTLSRYTALTSCELNNVVYARFRASIPISRRALPPPPTPQRGRRTVLLLRRTARRVPETSQDRLRRKSSSSLDTRHRRTVSPTVLKKFFGARRPTSFRRNRVTVTRLVSSDSPGPPPPK